MNKQLIVVKVGTSSLTGADGSMSPEKVGNIVRQIADLRDAGHSVVLVTSGSIAAGFRRFLYTTQIFFIVFPLRSAAARPRS